MLFWISEFDESCFSENAEILDAINNFGEAGQQGRHAVIGSKMLFKRLSSKSGLSRAAAAYFKWAAAALTQMGGLAGRKDCILVDNSVSCPDFVGGQWRVPLTIFSDQDFLGCSELICENLNDCESLIALAGIYLKKEVPNCKLRLRPIAGGGDTTDRQVLAALKEPNAPAVCIVDSDREFPGDGIGQTAKKCLNIGFKTWRTDLKVLEARELENIIPQRAMSALSLDQESLTRIERFHLVEDSIALFADLKCGESICRFHEISNSHPDKMKISQSLISTANNHPNFACAKSCQGCDCEIIPKLGEKFLARFVEWIKVPANGKFISDPTIWKRDLIDAVNKIIGYGLCFSKRAV